MENQKKEPQKICSTRTVGDLFACFFKPSKGICGGEKSKPALFSCTGRCG